MRFGINPNQKIEYESSPNSPKKLIVPMAQMIPNWYKESERWIGDSPGMKHCVPFLEALKIGYSMCLAQDIYFEKTELGTIVRYKHEPQVVASRPPFSTDPMPAPSGYDDEHFIWQTQTAVHIPEGYSAIFTHPLNRFDLPFITLTGVVDGDFFVHGGNIPFYLKNGFEGEIPAGTPIIQIIPFKREDWISKEKSGVWNDSLKNVQSEDYNKMGWYRRHKFRRKSYK